MNHIAAAKRGSLTGRAQIAYIIPYETDSAGAMVMKLAAGRLLRSPSQLAR